jgi:hypothetical protein
MTMATNKKAKHAIGTAITANTEQPAAIPAHSATSKANGEHPEPVPITPERANRTSVTGKHPRDVTETEEDTQKTCPIVHTTWVAWKAAPTFPIRVMITNLTLGGGKNDKKPSWMLLTPVNDNETRRYICWDRVPLEKFNVSVGQICDITGLHEVPAFSKITAFIKNYESLFECNGTLTITHQSDINAEYTPIPLLTASLVHQNAGVGRVSGIVEVVSTPIMGVGKSFVQDHEDEEIPSLTFEIKLSDDTVTGAFVWGDYATSLHEQNITISTHLLLVRAFAKVNGTGLSVSPTSTRAKDPMIIVLTPKQSAAQDAAIKRIQTLPDSNAMKAAHVHALQKRITALQAELTAIIKEMFLIISD